MSPGMHAVFRGTRRVRLKRGGDDRNVRFKSAAGGNNKADEDLHSLGKTRNQSCLATGFVEGGCSLDLYGNATRHALSLQLTKLDMFWAMPVTAAWS